MNYFTWTTYFLSFSFSLIPNKHCLSRVRAKREKTMVVVLRGGIAGGILLRRGSSAVGISRLPTVATVRATGGRGVRPMATEERATWLPGLDPPPYLDGKLAGDYGFDPLGLGEDPESLKWYVQAELVHARFAMLGVAGILFTDLLRITGIRNLPVWYEAGAVKFDFASTKALIVVQFLLMGFAETKRYMDFVSPGSQAEEGTFFGLEESFEGLEPGYPGGPLLNPLGLAKDIGNAHDWKLKEIKNGRLAMIAMLGFFVQAAVTHTGPIDNLVEHLSNPWHKTIIQTLTF